MDVCAVPKDFETIAFAFRTIPKPRIPHHQGYDDSSTIDEITLNASSVTVTD